MAHLPFILAVYVTILPVVPLFEFFRNCQTTHYSNDCSTARFAITLPKLNHFVCCFLHQIDKSCPNVPKQHRSSQERILGLTLCPLTAQSLPLMTGKVGINLRSSVEVKSCYWPEFGSKGRGVTCICWGRCQWADC